MALLSQNLCNVSTQIFLCQCVKTNSLLLRSMMRPGVAIIMNANVSLIFFVCLFVSPDFLVIIANLENTVTSNSEIPNLKHTTLNGTKLSKLVHWLHCNSCSSKLQANVPVGEIHIMSLSMGSIMLSKEIAHMFWSRKSSRSTISLCISRTICVTLSKIWLVLTIWLYTINHIKSIWNRPETQLWIKWVNRIWNLKLYSINII